MPIEIRELLIKVNIEEPSPRSVEDLDLNKMKQSILKECRREIKRELRRSKER